MSTELTRRTEVLVYPNRRLLLAFAFVLGACSDPSGPGAAPPRITSLPRQLTGVETEMVGAANSFGFDLFRQVNASFADSNVFMSPLSASMALGMTMNGAEGATFEQMRSTLGFGPRSYQELNTAYQSLIALLRDLDPQVDFRIANAIYYDLADIGAELEPAFISDSKQYFDAEVRGLDFRLPATVDTVNAWASRNTNGRIPKILNEIQSQIVMLLMNAIYFKGDWREAFRKSDTKTESFHALRGVDVSVPMMHRTGGFRVGYKPGALVAELPYGGDAFVMTILLPDEGVDINTFVAGLTPESWQAVTVDLVDARDQQDLYLPKFKLAWEDTLNNELKSMGMPRAFQPFAAEFKRISRSSDLYIDFVKQNAFVDVNEVGTEAAAVTVVGVGEVSAPIPVRLDRPFVFAIRERLSGAILFLGKIVEPKVN